jgi:hypothetical protein
MTVGMVLPTRRHAMNADGTSGGEWWCPWLRALLCQDASQYFGDTYQLCLVHLVLFVRGLGEGSLLDLSLTDVRREVIVDEGEEAWDRLLGFVRGGGGRGRDFIFLVFLGGLDFLQRGTLFCGSLASVFVALHVDQKAAAGTDSLAFAPGGAGTTWVEVSVADYFREFEGVGVLTGALVVVAVPSIGAARVVVVVFHLAVNAAVVVVAGRPVKGCMVIGTGLSYGG